MNPVFSRTQSCFKIPRLATLWAALLSLTGSVSAGVIIKENFEGREMGRVSFLANESIVPWEGPTVREYGWMAITDELPSLAASGHGKVIAIYDSSPAKNNAPTLQFRWFENPRKSGKLSVAWDFLVPVDDPYLAVNFVGKGWSDAAVIVLLSNGQIVVQCDKGAASRVQIGTYDNGKWCSLKLDLDITSRTFDAYLNNKKVLSAYAWQKTADAEVKLFSTIADLADFDRLGTPVLYLDNVEVIASP